MLGELIIILAILFVVALFAAVFVLFWNREKSSEDGAKKE